MQTIAKWPDNIPKPVDKPRLELLGLDGNAWRVIARAIKAAKCAGWSDEQSGAFKDLATSGDYDHLLRTCMTYFDVY